MKNIAASTPNWLAKASVYQINPRTFSKEGTIKAVTKELPNLAELGFSVVYLCPVFKEDESTDLKNWSIRQKASETGNPKNPYRMNNYFEIDSEYGTMDDLREFVNAAHSLGQKVLLDLVYLHMGPNADIFKRHPEFMKMDADGNVLLNYWNFPELDYDHQGVREYMWCNMVYYVGEIGVDGFRCDVGDGVPLDFWREGLRRCRTINPETALINEGSIQNYFKVFSSMYAFYWHEAIHAIITGEEKASHLRKKWQEVDEKTLKGARYLRDMDNHDTVTDWDMRVEKRIGHKGMELIQVMNFIIDGIPMVYAGNELADSSYQSMFANRFHMGKYEVTDRSIAKEDYSIRRQDIMKRLNALKKSEEILYSGKTVWLDNTDSDNVISFARVTEKGKIIFIGNLSGNSVECKVDCLGEQNKVILESSEATKMNETSITLSPYGYIVLKEETK